MAVLAALRAESRPMDIRTDSEYVLKGCEKYRFAWRQLKWRKVRNADLWIELDSELARRRPEDIIFTK
eukprot:3666163-Karenia_brevis.AAC.1